MKAKPSTVIKFILFITVVSAAITATMLTQRNRRVREFADYIISHGESRWAAPDSVRQLRASIAANERRIERHVQYAARGAHYWKLLAIRLQQRGLHGEALGALQRAIFYAPEDPMLHFYTGLSAAILARSFHLFPGIVNTDRILHFELAESAFLRAIDLDDRYLRPRFSLGVLYVFELDRPEEAIPHLLRYLEISRNSIDTMFVLARAFFMVGMFREAIELYDRIIVLTSNDQTRLEAQRNRFIVLGYLHG